MRVPRTNEDLKEELISQLSFLQNSCHLFDLGFENEAKRIAVALRILLADSKNSKSLLTAMGLKDKLYFYVWNPKDNEAKDRHKSAIFWDIGISLQPGGVKFYAHFDPQNYQKVTFDEWWNDLVVKIGDRYSFTRGDIIRSVADMDGGAHVDEKLTEAYFMFSRNQLLFATNEKGERTPLNSPAYVSIRESAATFQKALDEQKQVWS